MPRYKHGKLTKPISLEHFRSCVENADYARFAKTRNRSLLTVLYYSGCRVSQVLELRREDVTHQNGYLVFRLKPQKKGKEAIAKISLSLPFMDVVKRQVRKTRKGEKIWNISRQAVWTIVKQTFGPKVYPHYFRLNRATHFLEDESTTIPEMTGWFGWRSARTVDSYIGYAKRYTDKQAERLIDNP